MFKENSRNEGKNIVVAGYPMADLFLDKDRKFSNPWKNTEKQLKKIIWAPHHSILRGQVQYSSFLKYYDFIFYLAEKYRDKIQITFKPHPNLKKNLYRHKEWGQERTDKYYKSWDELENGQYIGGDYVDLFLTSDGMIHDSSSFMIEYHYTLKPVLFLSKVLDQLNSIGELAYNIHYKGFTKEDIIMFVENTIIAGCDPMKAEREDFFRNILIPPNNKQVANNIYDNLVQELNGRAL
jgi:CDP-glycerol glycerophosphotransferase (TagB/SpsB family)